MSRDPRESIHAPTSRFRLDGTGTRARVIGRDRGSGTRAGHDSRKSPPRAGSPHPRRPTDRDGSRMRLLASAHVASAHRVDRRRGPSTKSARPSDERGRRDGETWIEYIAMSSVVDARPVVETTPARRHRHHHHRHRAAVGVTARARRWARPSVAVTARGDGNVEEGGACTG